MRAAFAYAYLRAASNVLLACSTDDILPKVLYSEWQRLLNKIPWMRNLRQQCLRCQCSTEPFCRINSWSARLRGFCHIVPVLRLCQTAASQLYWHGVNSCEQGMDVYQSYSYRILRVNIVVWHWVLKCHITVTCLWPSTLLFEQRTKTWNVTLLDYFDISKHGTCKISLRVVEPASIFPWLHSPVLQKLFPAGSLGRPVMSQSSHFWYNSVHSQCKEMPHPA